MKKLKIKIEKEPWFAIECIEIYDEYSVSTCNIYYEINNCNKSGVCSGNWIYYDSFLNFDEFINLVDLCTLSEEEYFQLSLVWEYAIPIDSLFEIQKQAKSDNYTFNSFRIGVYV